MAMRSKTNIQTSWNSSEKPPIGACSQEGKNKQNNLEVACWNHPNLIPHTIPSFISILQRFDSTHLSRINKTISIFRDQGFDSILKWFTSLIQTVYPAARASSSDFFPFVRFSCSAPWQGLLILLCNQHGRNVSHFFHKGSIMLTHKLLNLLLALINALFLQLLVTPLGLHLPGHQVWCSNAATFQPAR